MNHTHILDILDELREDYAFPVFDNANFDYVKAKLSVFIDDNDGWLITIQEFGLSKVGLVVSVTYMGNLLPDFCVMFAEEPIEFLDEEGEVIDDIELESGFSLKPVKMLFYDNPYQVHFTKKDFQNSGIKWSSDHEWIAFLRLLAETPLFQKKIWLSSEKQFEYAEIDHDYRLLYETEEWRHPDGEFPSESPFFQSIAQAIVEKDSSVIKNDEESNTHWSHWEEFDSVEY
ncbi:DUF7003 family protein [Shouchella lonarensis]|uniref:Uncharacterized protein n=1 Tax=Shouchella lonarensis TaxID=1464122 RepID=A0A1G6GJS7_9BACI|nr:hypothetical protein [Shouchella lonarensis]SDB82282.1 hypothetical protein SAMN05421737_101165 [Shouchella lonarensis]